MLKLNIGCGPNLFPGWVNLDRVSQQGYIDILGSGDPAARSTWPVSQQKLSAQINDGLISCAVKDLREGFAEYPDSSVDAIYLGQMIEHLNPLYEAPKFLAECLRMLKPGGRIRVTTPDLSLLLGAYMDGQMMRFAPEQPEWYASAPSTAQLSYILFGACGPDCTFDNYEGHFAAYTVRWFGEVLEHVGFGASWFNEPASEVFADCIDCGMSHSFSCEASKLL